MKNCAYCDGQLMDTVVRCVHCGKDLNTPEAEQLAASKGGPSEGGAADASAPPTSSMAQAAAMPMAGGPPSINQMAEPAPDFSDQPDYFVMKTEMTAPGAAKPVTSKPGAGRDAVIDWKATASASLAILSSVMIVVAVFFLPVLTVSGGGTIDAGGRLGSVPIPVISEDMTVWQGGGLQRFLFILFAVALFTGGLGYLLQNDPRALRGFILLDGVFILLNTFWLSGDVSAATDVSSVFSTMPNIPASGGMTQEQMDRITQLVLDTVQAEQGIGMTVLWAAGAIAVVAGILGLLVAKKRKAPTAPPVAAPAAPPVASPPPPAAAE